jgi:hypothetical protein
MEEFQSGKLEKWLKVRNFDDQFELVKAIDKNSDLQSIAQQLCNIFDVTIDENDIKSELMVFEYQHLTSGKKEEQNTIKQIFSNYYNEILINKAISIKKIVYKGKTNEFTQVLFDDIRVIPIFKRAGQYFTDMKFKYKDKSRIFDCPTTLKGFDEQGFLSDTAILQGLSINIYEQYDSSRGFIELYVIDLDNKLNSATVQNAILYEVGSLKYAAIESEPMAEMVNVLRSIRDLKA